MILKPEIKQFIKEKTTGCYDGYMLLIKKVANNLNLKIFEAKFDDQSLSGQLEKIKDVFTIYVNKKHPINRKRFTVAHEIGHYISYLHDSFSKKRIEDGSGYEDYIYNRTDAGYSKEEIDAEIEANQIAAEILMQEDKVKELMRQSLTPEEMSQEFNVSPSAMTIRLQKLYPDIELM